MSRQYFRKYVPETSLASTGDISGQVVFNVTTGKNDTANLANGHSFFVIKSTLTRGDDTLMTDGVGCYRAWNWPAGLFTTAREKINGSTFNITNHFAVADSMLKRQRYSKDYMDTVGQLMSLNSDTERLDEAKATKTIDTIFVPACLSSFQIGELLPSTNLRLEFDVDSNWKKRVVESAAAKEVGTSNTTYKVLVSSIELYVLITENAQSVPQKVTHPYKLVEFKTELKGLVGVSSVNEVVKVDPSVVSVMYSLYNNDVNSDTRYAATKFEPGTAFDSLINQYIRYDGRLYPENMNNTLLNGTEEKTGYKLATYMNLVHNQLLWNGSGYEGDSLFEAYGRYYHVDLQKDPSSQAQEVNVIMNFSAAVTCSLAVVSSSTYELTVAYDDNGNMSGAPIKDYK